MKRTTLFTVRDMPVGERPRERLRRLGPEALSGQELIALVLGRGVAGRPVMDISQEMLSRFGGIKGLSEASIERLSDVKGVGPAKAAQIKACFELARRCDADGERLDCAVSNPEAAAKLVRQTVKDKAKEHFKLLLLNTRNRVTGIVTVSVGTLNASLVHPREVFREAIMRSAASVILAHNHPSGDPEPSEEDIRITKRLVEAGRLLGIEVVDHVIVTTRAHLSLRERGIV